MADGMKAPAKRATRAVNKRRATLVFSGKYEAVFDELTKQAEADDRDLDTLILRILAQFISGPPSTPASA